MNNNNFFKVLLIVFCLVSAPLHADTKLEKFLNFVDTHKKWVVPLIFLGASEGALRKWERTNDVQHLKNYKLWLGLSIISLTCHFCSKELQVSYTSGVRFLNKFA